MKFQDYLSEASYIGTQAYNKLRDAYYGENFIMITIEVLEEMSPAEAKALKDEMKIDVKKELKILKDAQKVLDKSQLGKKL